MNTLIFKIAKKYHEDFEKEYEERKVKVKDYDHITEKHQRYRHQDCNLNLSLSKTIPVVFHSFQNMIHILSFKKLRNMISR